MTFEKSPEPGAHIGGALETFDAFSNGSLQDALSSVGMARNKPQCQTAYKFLPQWLQRRQADAILTGRDKRAAFSNEVTLTLPFLADHRLRGINRCENRFPVNK